MVMRGISDYFLVTVSGFLFLVVLGYGALQYSYWVNPVIDTTGSNFALMPVDKNVYHPGDMVRVRFMFQKQRPAVGMIKWYLKDHGSDFLYRERTAAAPVGIYDVWTDAEVIPDTPALQPGKYHLEGTITYPLPTWFFRRNLIYQLRTECFNIER